MKLNRFFSIKTRDEQNVRDVANKGRNIVIHQLTCLKDEIQLNDNVFIVFGGDKPSWKTGLVAIGHVTRLPFDFEWKTSTSYRSFKIAVDIDVFFDAIVRSEFLPYPETYGTIGISPICTWEPNQAITAVEAGKAKAIVQAILELRPNSVVDIKNLLGEAKFAEITSSVKRYFIGESPLNSKNIVLPSNSDGFTFKPDSGRTRRQTPPQDCTNSKYRPYITAIKSKPFLLLAGISGTGKSRIVRELARACWPEGSEEYRAKKPRNFEMVQVKPNWHDSSELIGYVSRINGTPEYVVGDFLKFVARAWENWMSDDRKPYFMCLDEMNLAPVEQYFAEYLSVVESRKVGDDGYAVSDPIVKRDAEGMASLLKTLAWEKQNLNDMFERDGICLPPNLIVVGTVNMDETTFSFSRKVLDRAMTIEMNEVDLRGGLTSRYEAIGEQSVATLTATAVEGVDVYAANKDVCDQCIDYLERVNGVLEGTPFKVAYRTRNEMMLYVVNNLPYTKEADGTRRSQNYVVARALDEITSMKILSRIEGDESKVSGKLLQSLGDTIRRALDEICVLERSVSTAKLEEMERRLESGYTSFWS